MAFTESELAEHLKVIESILWARRRPPLTLRDRIREGQRVTAQSIELFFLRPAFERPGEISEEAIAKVQYVRTQNAWRIFWKRADGKWWSYKPHPETRTLAEALGVINADANACFFG
jgi:Protein of unknown function (DUF3024)